MLAKCRVPILIQDRSRGGSFEELTQDYDIEEPFFADGPVTRRLAVVDFDPVTGARTQPVRLIPPAGGRRLYRYDLPAGPEAITSEAFLAINAFGVVTRTMRMYEHEEVLGRPITWGFDGPQLLIVPRAGVKANAFYERPSRSLQFFQFAADGRDIFLSLSRDVVAHETGHAILDGLARDLYNSLSPQGLAMHEGLADITAALIALSSGELRATELLRTHGQLLQATAFSNVAEEFGQAKDPAHQAAALRSLVNQASLDPAAGPDFVASRAPHVLCNVLTGALWKLFLAIYDERLALALAEGRTQERAEGFALGIASERFRGTVLRALDYLPPGELTFADVGRAILASDLAAYPDATTEPRVIADEFVRRKMATADELALDDASASAAFLEQDLDVLRKSEWAAYDFAHRNRDLFGAPSDVPLFVRPRLDVTRLYHHREGPVRVRELLFKVSWDRVEPNPARLGLPSARQITVGTTIAVDWPSRRIRARIPSIAVLGDERSRQDRDDQLRDWRVAGTLRMGDPTALDDGSSARIEVNADLMRVRDSLRTIDLAERGA